jgi:hypothetical protein
MGSAILNGLDFLETLFGSKMLDFPGKLTQKQVRKEFALSLY